MRVKVDQIKFVEDLYPRNGFDNETVNQYRLNLDALPPITVTKDMVLVDGYHRLLAHRIEGREEIDAEIIDIPENQILWEATQRNSMHGRQLTRSEKRRLARKFYQQSIVMKDISSVLAVSEPTLSAWLKDLRQKADEEQKRRIINLYLRCKNSIEIANEIGLSDGRIRQIVNKFKTEEINEINLVPESLQLFNSWYFPKRDRRYGLEGAKGQIPGQIIENLLYYYTEPFDMVVDPMAGGGTTVDVCKSMYRRYRAYDVNPVRDDITKNDIREGFPKECKNCDLIFLDPPYFNMVFEELFKNVNDFYTFIRKLTKDSFKTVKKGGFVALLMQDMTEKDNHCLSGESYRIFRQVGFKNVAHISCPLTTEQFLPQQVEKAKKEKHLLGRNRDLYVFKKE